MAINDGADIRCARRKNAIKTLEFKGIQEDFPQYHRTKNIGIIGTNLLRGQIFDFF